MVQIIEENRRPSFGAQIGASLGQGIGQGLSSVSQAALQHSFEQKGKKADLSRKLAAVEQFKKTPFYDQLNPVQKLAIESEIAGLITGGTSKSLINAERELQDNEFFSQLFGGNSQFDQIKPKQITPNEEIEMQEGRMPSKLESGEPSKADYSDELLHSLAASGSPRRQALGKSLAASKEHKEKMQFEKGKFAYKRAEPVIAKADELAMNLPNKEQALEGLKDAIASGNFNYLSLNNLAEITGVEGFRDPKGALFKSSIKDYFLSDLSRVGARPNQWIEQQLYDALPRMGRDQAANEIVTAGFQAKLDYEKEWLKNFNELDQFYNQREGHTPGDIGQRVAQLTRPYVEMRQKQLKKQIETIKDKGNKNKFKKNLSLEEIFG